MSKHHHGSKPKQADSNTIDLLIKNLRLLDLDEEFDWPEIGPETFSASSPIQAQRERVRTGEWVLGKLFEQWDPKAAKESFQDLFPAVVPRQSIAFRALLFKQLTELKRDGVLSKEVVVRKTMLDDCKGPKFEELLLVFSTLVLHKRLAEDPKDGSVAKQYIRGDIPLFNDKIACLSLAYQSSCSSNLKQRRSYDKNWQKFGRVLKSKKDELEQRAKLIDEAQPSRLEKRIPQRTLDKLRNLLDANWTGDTHWVEILLHGDRHQPRNELLERTFDTVWDHACNDTLYAIRPSRNDSLLQSMQVRVEEQHSRLDRWRSIQERLTNQAEAMSSDFISETNGRHEPEISTPAQTRAHDEIAEHVASTESSHTESIRSRPAHTRNFSWHLGERFQPTSPLISDIRQAAAGTNPLIGVEHDERSSAPSEQDESATEIIPSVINAAPSPLKPATLAERAQMSLAMINAQKNGPLPQTPGPQRSEAIEQHEHYGDTDSVNPIPNTPNQRDTLAERTRQSMSLMSARAKSQPRNRRVSRLSNVYPINQFESPRKSEPAPYESRIDASILEEKALQEDEEAVFKSRPKIALSPPPTPMPALGENDEVEDDFA